MEKRTEFSYFFMIIIVFSVTNQRETLLSDYNSWARQGSICHSIS